MRPLLILAETKHLHQIDAILKKYGHPAVIKTFVRVLDADPDLEINKGLFHSRVLNVLQEKRPAGASQGYAVCATTELARHLGLKKLLQLQDITLRFISGNALAKPLKPNPTVKPQLANLLGECELSTQTAASELLGAWIHSRVDVNSLADWKGQFGQLGKLSWIADALLANTVLVAPQDLVDRFHASPIPEANAVVYNKDGRGTVKSGEVIANLLTKQLPDKDIRHSVTEAITKYPTGHIVMVEDGLWTGTEAVGVFESLLGRREEREKTQPLEDPTMLAGVTLTLVYGVATDYGIAMVSRYLRDNGLTNVSIFAAETIPVSSSQLLTDIDDQSFDVKPLRAHGPELQDLTPHFFNHFTDHAEQALAIDFCKEVGQQLFDNYLAEKVAGGWDPWDDQKRLKCCFGMNGLGLTHAFGHSVPKATLPLFWCKGTVQWKGHTVDWIPLFKNA
ncbi:hypothetical protein [Pseudomonas putida]|uniref:phosphoribosyltransferase-like protein n=1 Tax=Pseudomonas putida TaxID=303 RepID=UPI003906979D